jgi:hypothetical protein
MAMERSPNNEAELMLFGDQRVPRTTQAEYLVTYGFEALDREFGIFDGSRRHIDAPLVPGSELYDLRVAIQMAERLFPSSGEGEAREFGYQKVIAWLVTPSDTFDGRRPIHLIEHGEGRRVHSHLAEQRRQRFRLVVGNDPESGTAA